jgi:phosphatidylglycerophosphate synthase
MSARRSAGGGLPMALTVGRIALIPVISLSFMASPVITAVSLVTFMFADLFDGVLARLTGDEGPWRRAADSVVDRVAIDVCFVAAGLTGAMPALLVVAFLARDAYCSAICVGMMRERQVAIKADLLYRGLNGSLACWALAAPFLSTSGRSATALVLFGAALLVTADLRRSVRLVRRAPETVRNQVIDAGNLRNHQLDWDPIKHRSSGAEAGRSGNQKRWFWSYAGILSFSSRTTS